MAAAREGLPMATDQEPLTQTVQDHCGGWYDADAAPIAGAPWLPR